MSERTYTLMALTDLWTGDAQGKPDRVIMTGLLGSIRWWFEVLVRGLGGSACDPTREGNRCPGSRKQPADPAHHCVVCELFGCTGWARKFRFEVLDADDRVQVSQIKQNETFKLRFTELRPIRPEEWALLDLTLRLIAEYGAIGGKTVLKPSDEPGRANKAHHRDYGLIRIDEPPGGQTAFSQENLEDYIRQGRWRNVNHGDFAWASLKHFWWVKDRYLSRHTADNSAFNAIVGRDKSKRCKVCNQVHLSGDTCPNTGRHERRYSDDNPRNHVDAWLAGKVQESKKVFSFKKPESARRTFGFVKPGTVDFNEMHRRLGQAWHSFRDSEFLEGPVIIQALLNIARGEKR